MIQEDPLLMIPGPTNVSSEVYYSMIKPLISHRSEDFKELYENIIEKLKKVLFTKNIVIPLTASGTGAIEAVFSSLFKRNDKVYIVINGVFGERAQVIANRKGIMTICANIKWSEGVTKEIIEDDLDKHRDLDGFYIVYNETSTGVTNRPLEEMIKLAKNRGLLTIVDSISIVGGDYLYIDKWKIDICIGGSQKALGAPPVISFISISNEARERMDRVSSNSLYFDLKDYIHWYVNRRETPTTPAIPLFYALDTALNRVLSEGIEKRIIRHRKAANAFYNSIEKAGLELFVGKQFRSNTVISVQVPKRVNQKRVINNLFTYYNVLIAAGMGKVKDKIFRIGSMGEINLNYILRTLSGFYSVLNQEGFKININDAIDVAIKAYEKGVEI